MQVQIRIVSGKIRVKFHGQHHEYINLLMDHTEEMYILMIDKFLNNIPLLRMK